MNTLYDNLIECLTFNDNGKINYIGLHKNKIVFEDLVVEMQVKRSGKADLVSGFRLRKNKAEKSCQGKGIEVEVFRKVDSFLDGFLLIDSKGNTLLAVGECITPDGTYPPEVILSNNWKIL